MLLKELLEKLDGYDQYKERLTALLKKYSAAGITHSLDNSDSDLIAGFFQHLNSILITLNAENAYKVLQLFYYRIVSQNTSRRGSLVENKESKTEKLALHQSKKAAMQLLDIIP